MLVGIISVVFEVAENLYSDTGERLSCSKVQEQFRNARASIIPPKGRNNAQYILGFRLMLTDLQHR